ncbi:MAG: cobalamin-dependent protein, partial [Oscillospiraceae bacterium]|nr:cobalamin-dependent protein [Oscillospiraceae bacterium]
MAENNRVLLVHPEISRTKYNFAGVIDNEPLELEYISAMLKERGYVPEIWDGQVEKQPFAARLRTVKPFAVYVCGRTRQENFMKEYCAAAKAAGCITIVGGLHAQLNYKRFFSG